MDDVIEFWFWIWSQVWTLITTYWILSAFVMLGIFSKIVDLIRNTTNQ